MRPILASTNLAEEKESYSLFNGSDWQSGAYFEKRDYHSEKWLALQKKVATQGMRNAYLLAVAYQQHQYHLRDDCRTRSYPETLFSGREKRQYAPTSRTGVVTGYLLVLQKRPSDRSDLQHSCLRSA